MLNSTSTGGRLVAVLAAAAALTAAAGCSGRARVEGDTPARSSAFSEPPAARGPVDAVTWATRGEPTSLDPAAAFGGDALAVLGNVCESLIQQQPDGSTKPLLAADVKQPDDTTYVFTLRDGVTFFDGSPMTADDVVFSLQRIVDPAAGSFFGSYGKRVTSVKATGQREVTVKLSEPDPVFYQMLASPLGQVVKKDYVKASGSKYGTADALPMCTGPYQVTTWQRGQSISLKASENWWHGKDQLTRTAKFVFVADDATLAAGLTAGEIDGTFYAGTSSLPALKQSPKLNVYSGPSGTFDALVVAHTGGIMDKPGIRQAVRQTIDYKGTAQSLFSGYAEPLKALAPRGSWGTQTAFYEKAYNALPAAEQNLEGARKAVAESGVTNPTIVVGVPSFLPDYAAFAESFKGTAKQAGLDVELKLLPKADFFALYSDPAARAKIDLFYTQWLAWTPDPTEPYTAIATANGVANYGGYKSQEVSTLLGQASTTVEPAKRAELVAKAQTVVSTDLPWIPVVYEYQTLPLNKRLAGTTVASPTWLYTPWLARTGAAG